jgi:D-beta-D-heptose 7-phosphate kinase/D-beta-D-heptose 1-phosphate adenosyltransferase
MNILVIGDSCKDVFVYGTCDRLCPDAPVPVFIPAHKKENRGMAGNVYQNLLSLKADVDLITNDSEIAKTRYIDEKTNHMVVRIDSGEEKIERIENIEDYHYCDYDAIVISDYNKGFLNEEDIEYISQQHQIVFLDTKKLLGDWTKHVNFIKINEVEYQKTQHLTKDKDWYRKKLIVTKSSKGCSYNDDIFSVKKVEIKDSAGAGDTFLAALVYRYILEKNIIDAITFANKCATLVVQQKGVNTIDVF